MIRVKEYIKTLDERPHTTLGLLLLLIGLIGGPISVYLGNFDIIRDLDNFTKVELNGEAITAITVAERPTGRGKYKRIKVEGKESTTYPMLIDDWYADTLVSVGQKIWKKAESNRFKIKVGVKEIDFELVDQRKSRRIHLAIVMTMIIVVFGTMVFLGTLVDRKYDIHPKQ